MKNVRHKRCEKCKKRAIYGNNESLFCKEHSLNGMISLNNKK